MEDRLLAERILDQLADAVIYANRSGEIVRWNRASTDMFGFSAEEALGLSLDLIIPEHLRASHWRGFNAAMTKGVMRLRGRPTLTRALDKSGRKLYVEMTFAVVKGDEAAGQFAAGLDRLELGLGDVASPEEPGAESARAVPLDEEVDIAYVIRLEDDDQRRRARIEPLPDIGRFPRRRDGIDQRDLAAGGHARRGDDAFPARFRAPVGVRDAPHPQA